MVMQTSVREWSPIKQTTEERKQYKRQHRLDNLEHHRNYAKSYYHNNKEKISAQRKERYRLKVEAEKAHMKQAEKTELLIKKNQ